MLLTNSAGIKKLLWGEELQEHELNSNLNMKNRMVITANRTNAVCSKRAQMTVIAFI